jgi:hydrophobe/amphiphile efflux-1 (HAE1) family protein
MKTGLRTGGLAAWSIRRPVAVTMLSLTVVVMGLFAFDRLNIDLLPQLIYPEVRIRVIDSGVPARIMEDQVTRQLEEQLAITEGAIAIQSQTSEGSSSIDLSFPYGTDIDLALRDASTRLDRAKRFLPDTIDPPTIFKRDPSQIPVMELIVSSSDRDGTALREWVDYEFARWFLNIEGVASTEVGGGLIREIQIVVDQEKLAARGLTLTDISNTLEKENIDVASGTLYSGHRQLSARTQGRVQDIKQLAKLPILRSGQSGIQNTTQLGDVAQLLDTHQDERLRVRLNGEPGVKLSIQKQPQANTVAVVDGVTERLQWFKEQKLLPEDINIQVVSDQSGYIRSSLSNASMAALSGALLATLVVYLFLGNWRGTFIIASAIPLAMLITLSIMGVSGLTLNIMSLGGLAMGVGMLVDNTIVMLENITRHQEQEADKQSAAIHAAGEITSAVAASTTTNLAAVLPFIFIGGLIGLIFNELIITLSASILASLLVALTLVPALGARLTQGDKPAATHHQMNWLRERYVKILQRSLAKPALIFIVTLPLLISSAWILWHSKEIFLPDMDQGQISIRINGDPGIRLDELDSAMKKVEDLLMQQPEVQSVFTLSGGAVFGRTTRETPNQGSFNVQLKPVTERNIDSKTWSIKIKKQIDALQLAGYTVRATVSGIRGIRLSSSDNDISLRIQGSDLETLTQLGNEVVQRIKDIDSITNVEHSYEEQSVELVLQVNRDRAADLGLHAEDIGNAINVALDGEIISDYYEGDRKYDMRMRLNKSRINSIQDMDNIIVGMKNGRAIRMRDVGRVEIKPAPANIYRDGQRRMVEITATLQPGATLNEAMEVINSKLTDLTLPDGYNLYDAGGLNSLREGKQMGTILLALALFLVMVVMAVQYESLSNPIVIIVGAVFSIIGVALSVLLVLNGEFSMPAKIGMILLTGIVVNNSIILLEQVEIQREQGFALMDALTTAAGLRVRPILMTTLTTVVGMLPLAFGMGEGSEMLQPMAAVTVFGMLFAMVISLLLVPTMYYLVHRSRAS